MHSARQPVGSTCTFSRLRQCVQYLGGSNLRAEAQAA